MSRFWWLIFRALARIAVRLYHRSFRVSGVSNVPAIGPVLLVVNHPSSLFDAAAVLAAVPRPLGFAAKGPLFAMPVVGWALRKLGGVAIHRPEDAAESGATGEAAAGAEPSGAPEPKGLRRNLASLAKFVELLRAGGAAAIFPEGVTHLEPQLRRIRSGPARIALDAEEAAGWDLGLEIVPIGLQYEPQQRFRGDVTVRIGRPFGVADLRDEPRHDAIRTVQARIEGALRPLVVHLDHLDMEPFVRRIAEIYDEHQIANPSPVKLVPRAEIVRVASACLNHFLVTDPAAIDLLRRDLARYERLTERLRVSPLELERAGRPGRAFLGWLGRVLEIVLGFPVFAAGLLVAYVPYRATDVVSRRITNAKTGREPALSHTRLVVGLVLFGVPWAVLAWLVQDWTDAPVVTAVFVAAMAASSLYARRYAQNFGAWMERLRSLWPVAFRRRALHRASLLRSDLLTLVVELAHRFEAETGAKLVPPRETRLLARIPLRAAGLCLITGAVVWFAWGLRDAGEDVADLPPVSPWPGFRGDAALVRVRADAAAVAGMCDALADLETRMVAMRAEYEAGQRSHYSPADNIAVDQSLLTYLTCRNGLLRITWFYRDPDAGPPDLGPHAFLLCYASAVELASRAMQFVDIYGGESDAVRKINAGNPTWEVPPGTLDRVRSNLADRRVLDALAAATARFEAMRAAGRLPAGPPWDALATKAASGARTVEALSAKLSRYKWDRAVQRATETVDAHRYAASAVVSTWIGDARIRSRPHTAGLIRPEQLAAFRAKLRPGDILLERRNWYLSNVFLPGFWPHGALYVGGEEGLRELGLADDARIAPHLAAFRTPDHDGHLPAILESISEGVVATSMEESIGGADSVAAFRPLLPRAEIAEAVARGLRHRGKPYDFDFDFFSHDKLVCTELVFHAYEGPLHFELQEIMGRRTLPALEFVRKWDRERGTPAAQLEFVAFLDGDENAGTAREGDEAALVGTLTRPGVTFLQAHEGAPRAPGRVVAVLAGVLGLGMVFLRRR